MSNKNIDTIRRLTQEGYVGGHVEVVDETLAKGFVDHDAMPGADTGVEGQRQTCQMVVSGLSNRRMVEDEYLEVGNDRVVENWVFQGTHTGDFMGVPATGKEVTIRGMEIWKFDHGKIVERWGVIDSGAVFDQMGAVPVHS